MSNCREPVDYWEREEDMTGGTDERDSCHSRGKVTEPLMA